MILEKRFANAGWDVDSLTAALPDAEFVERHSLVVSAPLDVAWSALHELSLTDLRLTAPFLALRGLARRGSSRPARPLLGQGGPVPLLTERAPTYAAGGRVARPWQPRPAVVEGVDTLAALAAFDEPGWLKYGTDFRLEEVAPGRTRVTSWTRCEATDDRARRRFRPYWWLIRPFSGLIRREMLAVLARRCQEQPLPAC